MQIAEPQTPNSKSPPFNKQKQEMQNIGIDPKL